MVSQIKRLENTRERRVLRSRSRLRRHSTNRYRVCVFRSNKVTYAQLFDELEGRVVCGVDSRHVKESGSPSAKAKTTGLMMGVKLRELGIEAATFDRGNYQYHGRVAAVAEGIRESGVRC